MKKLLQFLGAVILALLITMVVHSIFETAFIPALMATFIFAFIGLTIFAACSVAWRAFRYRGRVRTFANIAEGIHGDGYLTKKAATVFGFRYALCKIGADVDHMAINSVAGEKVIAVCIDEPQAVDEYVSFGLLGNIDGTCKMVCGGNVALGDTVESDGTGKIRTIQVGAGHYELGVALQAGVLNDVIEIAHGHPIHRPS